MNTATVPAKIVMRGTSQQSLNDRFTTIAAQPPVYSPPSGYNDEPVFDIKPVITQRVDRVTAINRRLAKEMENRPSVQAALGIRQPRMQKQSASIMHRLGAKARLGFKTNPYAYSYRPVQSMAYVQNGYSYYNNNRSRSFPWRNSSSWNQRKQQQTRWAEAVLTGDGIYRPNNRYYYNRQRPQFTRGTYNRGGYGSRGYNNRFVRRGGFRRGRGGFGRGRGGFGGQRRPVMTRDELDSQLEEYMVKTKQHLDAEMDSYMVEAAA